ncbi:unnamed protein product [Rotaria sordida]|uniref:Uncharacterized protein n=1 Tax=Rotaria sordida TaxID=392033 RepID=A0A813YUA5_9BILA|nr:unnamed protein product [Rotaria sordida]CAF0889118.1 unnamed protein product [Rotaria sordida]
MLIISIEIIIMCYQICLETFILFLFITSFVTAIEEATSSTKLTSGDTKETNSIDSSFTSNTENSLMHETTMTNDVIRITTIKTDTNTTISRITTTTKNSATKHSILNVFVFMIIVQIII